MDPQYYQIRENDTVRCALCPHCCVIGEGKSGICGVRVNRNGQMVLPYAGRISALAVDPIEKKPLYHFYPGQSILSVGFVGCSFRCPFCQNYSISQNVLAATQRIDPAGLVETARERKSFGIAYTYSEPTSHFEYVRETASLARDAGLKNVLVSNGYLQKQPAETLLGVIDAANIDLKSFNPEFYRKEIGGTLNAVLDFLRIAAEKTHLEITTLVIPGKNDSPEEIEKIADFIASLSPDIPLHLSAYYPTYHYDIPATPPGHLHRLAGICREKLHYVYLGNIRGDSNTSCHNCGNLLISRSGYRVSVEGIENGHCSSCGISVPVAGG